MALKIKEDSMKIGEPAKDEEITATFENIHVVDSDISVDKLRKEDLKKNVALHDFVKNTVIGLLMFSSLRS